MSVGIVYYNPARLGHGAAESEDEDHRLRASPESSDKHVSDMM